MSRILLLATTTGYQTRAFGEAAERAGVEIVFATDRCDMLDDPWQDAAIPVRFHEPRKSVEAIAAAARTRPIDGILVVGDRPTVIAARAAAALGLPGNPPEAAAVARDKRRTRERLKAAGLAVPWFVAVPITADPDDLLDSISFPCVVKPLALSGSRGVIRANDAGEFCEAFGRLRRLLLSTEVRVERTRLHDVALIEGFIPGREFALEGVLHDGALHAFALFDKPDPLDGPFFEETIYVTPSRVTVSEQRAIESAIAEAASVIGLRHGPIHAECRLAPPASGGSPSVFVLEVAARPIGGLCARALRLERVAETSIPSPSAVEKPANGDGMNFPGSRAPNPEQISEAAQIRKDLAGQTSSRPHSSYGTRNSSRPHFAYEEFLLRNALGESPSGWRREARASGVMMIPIPSRGMYRDVAGVEAARAIDGVDDIRITAKPDQVLVPLPEGASYLGFIFAHAATPATVERALRDAHACLGFAIDPELRVVQSAHG